MSKNDMNLLLELDEQMAAIIDFLPTMECLKYFLTTPSAMYGIPVNPMIDTKNTNLPLLCQKCYAFIAWP